MPTYEHKQFSPWLLPVVAAVIYAFFRFGLDSPEMPGRLAAAAAVTVIAIAFTELKTRVDPGGVSWAFTLGVPGGFIPFVDIADVQMTRTSFWEGWGIHWTILHGWLWNVSGFQGVMIRKRNGRIVTLGTDDPDGLYQAIQGKDVGGRADR